jgi:hypothetical protein
MAKTKSFRDLVERRVKDDPKFAEALLREGMDTMLSGDLDTINRRKRDNQIFMEASPYNRTSARRFNHDQKRKRNPAVGSMLLRWR